MHLIEIETYDSEVFEILKKVTDDNENMDIIQGKNFSGNISNIEIYAPLIISVISTITPILMTLINKHRISSIKIDGDKLDISNASEKITKLVVEGFFEKHKNNEEENKQKNENVNSTDDNNATEMPTENEEVNETSNTNFEQN